MLAARDSEEDVVVGQQIQPSRWALGTLQSSEWDGPATGAPRSLLPAPGPGCLASHVPSTGC